MANEIESTDVQGCQVIPVFVGTCGCANNDHWNFSALTLQVPYDVPIRAIDEPETAETGRDVLLGKRRLDFFHSTRPQGVDCVALQKLVHATTDLRICRRQQDVWPPR